MASICKGKVYNFYAKDMRTVVRGSNTCCSARFTPIDVDLFLARARGIRPLSEFINHASALHIQSQSRKLILSPCTFLCGVMQRTLFCLSSDTLHFRAQVDLCLKDYSVASQSSQRQSDANQG